MLFFQTFIRWLCAALISLAVCCPALARSTLRLVKVPGDNIVHILDGTTVIWSGTLPDQMPASCLEIALERPGATIVCSPHVTRRLGLRFEWLALMPIQEKWEWQSYSARATSAGPDITLRAPIRGVETHITLSILFWICALLVPILFWLLWGRLPQSSRRHPPN